jgi:hypothetical protein
MDIIKATGMAAAKAGRAGTTIITGMARSVAVAVAVGASITATTGSIMAAAVGANIISAAGSLMAAVGSITAAAAEGNTKRSNHAEGSEPLRGLSE